MNSIRNSTVYHLVYKLEVDELLKDKHEDEKAFKKSSGESHMIGDESERSAIVYNEYVSAKELAKQMRRRKSKRKFTGHKQNLEYIAKKDKLQNRRRSIRRRLSSVEDLFKQKQLTSLQAQMNPISEAGEDIHKLEEQTSELIHQVDFLIKLCTPNQPLDQVLIS